MKERIPERWGREVTRVNIKIVGVKAGPRAVVKKMLLKTISCWVSVMEGVLAHSPSCPDINAIFSWVCWFLPKVIAMPSAWRAQGGYLISLLRRLCAAIKFSHASLQALLEYGRVLAGCAQVICGQQYTGTPVAGTFTHRSVRSSGDNDHRA